MNSIPDPKETKPHDAPAAPADERLAHAHEQIKRADEQLTRLTEQLAKMERDDAHPPSAGPAPQSPSAEPAPPSPQPGPQSPNRLTLRTLAALPLAACIVVAALVLQSSYGGGAKRWAPQLASTPSLPPGISHLPSSPRNLPFKWPRRRQHRRKHHHRKQHHRNHHPWLRPHHRKVPRRQHPRRFPTRHSCCKRSRATWRIWSEPSNSSRRTSNNGQRQFKSHRGAEGGQEEMKRSLAKVSEQNPPRTSAPATRPASTFRMPERSQPRARARPRYPREWMYDDYDW